MGGCASRGHLRAARLHGVRRVLAFRFALAVLLTNQVHPALTQPFRTAVFSHVSSSGAVAVVDPQVPLAPVFVTNGAHSAEAWCCAWLDNDVFMSGADDCTFKLWDRRCPAAAVRSVRAHEAGVTFLGRAPDAADPAGSCQVFLSGGYDG